MLARDDAGGVTVVLRASRAARSRWSWAPTARLTERRHDDGRPFRLFTGRPMASRCWSCQRRPGRAAAPAGAGDAGLCGESRASAPGRCAGPPSAGDRRHSSERTSMPPALAPGPITTSDEKHRAKHILGALGAALWGLLPARRSHATLEAETPAGAALSRRHPHRPRAARARRRRPCASSCPRASITPKPMPKAGWTLETVKGAYADPFRQSRQADDRGARARCLVGRQTFAGRLVDEFTIRGTCRPRCRAGHGAVFPAVQECANGTADWTDTTGQSGPVKNPRPPSR